MAIMKICEDCKNKKLVQVGVKMKFGIGYECIGKCEICGRNNNYLYEYSEEKDEK